MMENSTPQPNGDILIQIVSMEMPYGKYKGTLIYRLPMFYLEWHKRTGFPKGKMGILLETIYEIKLNGLEDLLKPLIRK